MTNEEIKANSIAYTTEDKNGLRFVIFDADKIIKLKDQQFKEYLEKKIHTIESMKDIDTTLSTDAAVVRTIKEIINETFQGGLTMLIDLDKACEWIEQNLSNYDYNVVYIGETRCEHIANDFRKAMSNSPEFEGIETCNPDKNLQGFDSEYLQSKIDLHTKYMQEHNITSEQQLSALAEMRGELTLQDIQKIHDVILHTARLDKEGKVRPAEEFYGEVLEKLNNNK